MIKVGKLLLAASCAVLAAAACGCASNDAGKDKTQSINDVKIEYSTDGATTTLNWGKVDGVKFSVYRADTRYGKSELLQENITSGGFVDEFRYGYYRVIARDEFGKKLRTFDTVSEEIDMFGDGVYVISPDDGADGVNAVLDNINGKQFASEFSSDRYAVLFKQGEYDDKLTLRPGYYTTYSGLGTSPDDVKIRSLVNPNRESPINNALINFWRGVENMTFTSDSKWAVSQGTFLRRVNVNGRLDLHDVGGYASGGFIADSKISGTVEGGSQQQWLMYNSEMQGWGGNVWNMCFSGTTNAPACTYPDEKYTVREKTPIARSKPYLVFADDGYKLAVPNVRTDVSGAKEQQVEYLDADELYFARADRDDADTINAALGKGLDLVFTPGIYSLDKPIEVKRDGTVIFGMGLATLVADNPVGCMSVTGGGVTVAGLLFEAGARSDTLMALIGSAGSAYIHDTFFRVGGASDENTRVNTCLDVAQNGTYLNNVWIWRADHGSGVGWDKNVGMIGLSVSADNVIADGLFSEHFLNNNVLWNGNGGKVFFYQSEVAYDVPSNESWQNGDRKGYPSFEVGAQVMSFEGKGMGVYTNFRNDSITLDCAVRVPDAEGVTVEHLCAVAISGGTIEHIINDFGGSVKNDPDDTNIKFVNLYSNGNGE